MQYRSKKRSSELKSNSKVDRYETIFMKQDRYKFHVIDSDGKVKVTITLSQPMSEFIKNGPDLKS